MILFGLTMHTAGSTGLNRFEAIKRAALEFSPASLTRLVWATSWRFAQQREWECLCGGRGNAQIGERHHCEALQNAAHKLQG